MDPVDEQKKDDDKEIFRCVVKLVRKTETDGELIITPKNLMFLQPKTGKKLVVPSRLLKSHQTRGDLARINYSSSDGTQSKNMKLKFDALADLHTVAECLVQFERNEVPHITAPKGPSTKTGAAVPGAKLDRTALTELKHRERLNDCKSDLLTHPVLSSLFQELVESGIVTEGEFWSEKKRASMLDNEMSKDDRVGLSSAMSKKPLLPTNSSSEKITITPEFMHHIFVKQPAVRAAWKANVPDQISETDFWVRYFRTYLFNQPGTSRRGQQADTMFAQFEKEEEAPKGGYHSEKRTQVDRSVDLATSFTDHAITREVLPLPAPAKGPTKFKSKERQSRFSEINRHGQLVVQWTDEGGAGGAASRKPKTGQASADDDDIQGKKYQAALQLSLVLPDLRPAGPVPTRELNINQDQLLRAGAVTHAASAEEIAAKALAVQMLGQQMAAAASVGGPEECLTNGRDAVTLITAVTLQSHEMYRAERESVRGKKHREPVVVYNGKKLPIPKEFAKKLRELTARALELFRHYWACFPLTKATKEKSERVLVRLNHTYAEAEQMQNTCRGQTTAHLYDLPRPLLDSLNKIFDLQKKKEKLERENPAKRRRLATPAAAK